MLAQDARLRLDFTERFSLITNPHNLKVRGSNPLVSRAHMESCEDLYGRSENFWGLGDGT